MRKERHLKQADIARMLGVKTVQTVSRWETGKMNPKREVIEKLMDFFQCDYRDLYRNPTGGTGSVAGRARPEK
jgi:transcriptional regulator with XRE-family HTH domain